MTATREYYLKQAIQNEQEAAGAALDNVRERALRSAVAWRQMAQRLERSEAMRNARENESAAADAEACA